MPVRALLVALEGFFRGPSSHNSEFTQNILQWTFKLYCFRVLLEHLKCIS